MPGLLTVSSLFAAVITFGDVSYLASSFIGTTTLVGSYFTIRQLSPYRLSRIEEQQLKLLASFEAPEGQGFTFYPNDLSSDIHERIQALTQSIDGLSASRDLETRDLEIGTVSGQLRAQMSSILQIEMAKWLGATKQQILKVTEVLNSNRHALDAKQAEVNALEGLLIEASKVVNVLDPLSEKLTKAIEEDQNKLSKITPDPLQQTSYNSMKTHLSQMLAGQRQFTMTLRSIVRNGITNSLNALRAVREAESNLQVFNTQRNILEDNVVTIENEVAALMRELRTETAQ